MKYNIFAISLLWPCIAFSETAYVHEIPDFTQTAVRGEQHGHGQQYCAPVAVSNSLVWLKEGSLDQLSLIHKLASREYMRTSLANGTGTTGVLRGVDKIAQELFGGYERLEYQGWRKHPEEYSTGIKVPEISSLYDAISRRTAAWLNVGWYKLDRVRNEYRRIGGHWVTLVGSDQNKLILHDPAPRAGTELSNEVVEVTIIEGGTLVGNKTGLPTPARGYAILGQGMHIKSKADLAILDGVVYFELSN